jgi:hypothetical protein
MLNSVSCPLLSLCWIGIVQLLILFFWARGDGVRLKMTVLKLSKKYFMY